MRAIALDINFQMDSKIRFGNTFSTRLSISITDGNLSIVLFVHLLVIGRVNLDFTQVRTWKPISSFKVEREDVQELLTREQNRFKSQ